MSADARFLKLIPFFLFVLLAHVASAQPRTLRPPSIEEAPLTPPTTDLWTSSQFGVSVAVDGDTAVIGAHRALGADGAEHGAAMVFTRNAGEWTMTAKLTASNPAAFDHFGWSVGVSGDCIVVSSEGGGSTPPGNGAAYVFSRQGDSWSQSTILTPDDANPHFGNAVAVVPGTILIGANVSYGFSSNFRGAAYVFEQIDGKWTQTAKLEAADGAIQDSSAGSLDLDGDTAILGAPSRNSAYVFTRAASIWQQTAKITPAAPLADYGFSVALSGDTAVLGSPEANDAVGAARVFVRANDIWTEQALLESSSPAFYGHFGWSVAVNHNTAIVGTLFENGVTGAIHIFTRAGSHWQEASAFTASDAGASDEWFGWAVAADQTTLVAGAPFFSGPAGIDQGRAWAYQLGIPGDTNCDGSVDAGDKTAFILALTDPPAFGLRNAGCPMTQADLNGDGLVNGLDIPPFVDSTAP